MKIYVCHKRYGDFEGKLYKPIKNSSLVQKHKFIFPHEGLNKDELFNTKDLLRNKRCDLVIAEVSEPATGLGIELGWASVYEIPIICMYKKGSDISESLKLLTDRFIEYETAKNMIEKLNKEIK